MSTASPDPTASVMDAKSVVPAPSVAESPIESLPDQSNVGSYSADETENSASAAGEPPIRVMALHALLYCERLYYLEEVEEIRVADAAVYAGRRLHDDVVPMDDESPEKRAVEVASERWGLFGKIDAVRRRDGAWVAYEHKRGRCRRGDDNTPLAWPSDRIQAVAYAIMLEEALGESVPQARIRYHAENVTAFVNVDDTARQDLAAAVARARQLRHSSVRPPIADNEHLCRRCSLAPICLPEEERLEPVAMADRKAPTLFPSNRERQTVHVISPKAHVGRSRDTLVVTTEEGTQKVPIQEVDAVVIHGFGQLTTQAIHLCAFHGVAVQWMTCGGRFAAGTSASPGRVQQRIRQYTALTDETTRLRLARQLVHAKASFGNKLPEVATFCLVGFHSSSPHEMRCV